MNGVKKRLLLLPMAFIFMAFLIVPLLFMIIGSLQSDIGNQWTMANYVVAFENAYYSQAFVNSVLIAISSSVLGLVGTLILCLCLTSLSSRMQESITFISNLAANFAGIPLAFSFIILLGNVGVLKMILPILGEFNLYSWLGLTITYVYFQIPLGVLFLYPSIREVKKEWVDSVELLGASRVYAWRKVVLPFLRPSIASTFVILFANGMGTYETAYALTGSNINLLTVRIAALVSGDVFAKPNMGSALAVLFGVILVLAMALIQRKGKVMR
ncbi:ABC transporter permease [Candidatus Enterococcus ikei]|uniref:ABC transporter permease subunit n=1 Tax=Candidatus Enterococcus ikei TaxID=2815326 RepID=A0ABS3H0H7_9ENTE|nr:ABC transporter permease subunit [Enterococcus sp. DIV0869a]MBO0441017.1 ABC transporter permease subunit [Enterococcus sp. DIV0869a]